MNNPTGLEQVAENELEGMLYARHAEIKNLEDLTTQRGTPIPALFNQFYKFVQNPSTVSVETFKRMVDTDDTIGSGVDFLTTCLAARLGSYVHPSQEVTQFVNDAFDRIEGGFYNTFKEIMSASWAGFYVGEKVWSNDDMGFIIKRVVALPPGTVLFETERTGQLTPDGILQYQRNYNPANLAYGVNGFGGGFGFVNSDRPDPMAKLGDLPFPIRTGNTYNYLSIRIPVQKCIHYAFDAQGKFGNPYGRSLLRRAYKWYVMKDAFLQMLSIALDRKGTPLTVVYADPNVTLNKAQNVQMGNNVRDQRNQGIRADKAAQDAFKNIHNDSTIILPGKKGQVFETDFVPQTSNAQDFMSAIDMCNKSILRALLVPSLIFGNGDGTGSYSLGQEHAKTFDKILDGMNFGAKEALRDQFVRQLIMYNFPESVWKKDGFGDFGKREMSPEEIEKEMETLERAVNMGAIDMNDLNDLNQIRDKVGFEPLESLPEKEDLPGIDFLAGNDDQSVEDDQIDPGPSEEA